MRRGPASRTAGAALLALATGLLACPLRVPFGERIFFHREAPPPAPEARDCARCHGEIYDEWEASLHARAWRSEAFQQASAGTRAEVCTGCHAAAPVAADVAPTLRDVHREEGVTCVTCHMSPDPDAPPLTMRGPVARSSPVEVHPLVEEDPFYRSSALCGSCHRASLDEWRAAAGPDTPTCQGCHMPEVRRTVESVNEDLPYSAVLVALEETLPLRRHLFAVPDDAEEHVDLAAAPAPDGASLRVRVVNRLPHALPTGAFGRRQLRVVARRDASETSALLVASRREAVPAGEARTLTLPLPVGGDAPGDVEVSLERFDHARGSWERLVRASVTQDTPSSAP